jgi:hypothetical protein
MSAQPIITYQKTAQLSVEIYVQPPTKFIIENSAKLLPQWKNSPQTVVIILLHSTRPLEIITEQVQEEKKRLKEEFLQLGQTIKSTAQRENWLIEIIDPQEGKPINSANGEIIFDTVAVVHQLLGFDFNNTKDGCKVLNHPSQKTAIYPSLLLSDAQKQEIYYLVVETINSSIS